LAGYEDLNDAERLSQDPTFGLISSEKTWDRGVALTSRLQSFETEILAEDANFAGQARAAACADVTLSSSTANTIACSRTKSQQIYEIT
jgi:hypothetical protein